MAHIWTSSKMSGDYGNGTLLDHYGRCKDEKNPKKMAHVWTSTKNDRLREWHTFEPVQKQVVTKGMAYF